MEENICLICNKKTISKRGLFTHISTIHGLSSHEYKKRFNLLCFCSGCNKEINCNNKSGCCNSCRDRTGKNNPFFNKTHSNKTKDILKQKCKVATTKLWENSDYREKVISGTSKPRNNNFSVEQSERIKLWYKNNPEQKNN